MLHRKEGCDKFSSLGIYEIYSEEVNDKHLLGLKDNIKEGYKI